jgi:Tfp pilus assembly protein PilN
MIYRANFFREPVRGLSYKKMGEISMLLLGLFLALVIFQYWRTSHARQLFSELKNQIERIQKNQGLASVKGAPSLSPVEFVSSALASEPSWPELLRVITRSLPDGIWLDEMRGEFGSEGGEITLQGTTHQARLLPGFLDRLRSYNTFTKVDLLSSESPQDGGNAALQFKIQAHTKVR